MRKEQLKLQKKQNRDPETIKRNSKFRQDKKRKRKICIKRNFRKIKILISKVSKSNI